MPDYQRVADEFGLGRLRGMTEFPGGRAHVAKLVTERGEFVAKPSYRVGDEEVYEQVALALDRAGVRQARPWRTTAGALVGKSGYAVQECLPGGMCPDPSPAQYAAVMRHIPAYHLALGALAVPVMLREQPTLWQRVASVDYLLTELPRLSHTAGLPEGAQDVVTAALARLAVAAPGMRRLPAQLIHGDIGPDNVLMDGDDVVAVVDFTPHYGPVVFAVATAVYWYHVYGREDIDLAAVRAGWDAAGESRPWSAAETEAWPAMLIREALRRLATPLALGDLPGAPVPPATGPRWQAVRALLGCWPRLAPTAQR